MMLTVSERRIARANAIAFFLFWSAVLFAGADKPPPVGFLWIILNVFVCAGVVYWRIPTYVDWYRSHRPGRHWRVLVDGFVAGLVVALPFALKGSGEPTITMQTRDYIIWFLVVGVVGVLNSVTLYFVNALIARAISVRGSTG